MAARITGFLFLSSIILISDFLNTLQPACLLVKFSACTESETARVCAVQHALLALITDFLKRSQGSHAQTLPEGGLSLQAVIALPAQSLAIACLLLLASQLLHTVLLECPC